MSLHYEDATIRLHHGDCLDVLRELPDASVDAVCTDPPYNLSFMAKAWDVYRGHAEFQAWCEQWAVECLRVLKPGGHLLAFGGTRTWHRLACAVEDAGFEIRDSIAWMYGSGFPKSLDVSKAIDKAAGAEREITGRYLAGLATGDAGVGGSGEGSDRYDVPVTPEAECWQGWGTALKPAFEPVVVARKPLVGTVAANVLAHGTGALNVDGCRVEGAFKSGWSDSGSKASENASMSGANYARGPKPDNPAGRWPANVVLDESQAAALDAQSGPSSSPSGPVKQGGVGGYDPGENAGSEPRAGFGVGYADTGGASRFYYTAKTPTTERIRLSGTSHPTVKPLSLMRWLVRLVTPPGGTVLEPFAGSGTTVEACLLEGFRCIAIERETDYLPLIVQRLHRRLDPVEAVRASGEDAGLFDLLEAEADQ